MTNEEKIELLRNAQNLISEAIDNIRAADDSDRVRQYLIASLEQDISDDNKWLGGGNPVNIQSLIDKLQE